MSVKDEKKADVIVTPEGDVIIHEEEKKPSVPVVPASKEVTTSTPKKFDDALKAYLHQISKYKLLSIEEEKELTKQLIETGDIEVAKKLVTANLRLVVKIALEYKSSYKNILDLIQEGNIGLMKAVSKYDPSKGAKLSYYASWWIRSYILKFILDNFRLVKIGTTQEQKKLFYNLMREKERLMNQGLEPDVKLISQNLGVSEKAVKEMDMRLSSSGSEVSIDKPQFADSNVTLGDMLSDDDTDDVESALGHMQGMNILQEHLQDFVEGLKERDKDVFKKRLLSEVPPSLQSIADEYGVSRERIRQIEERLIKHLKVYMSEYIR
jgi:RNA polymerase sigma-32 factor